MASAATTQESGEWVLVWTKTLSGSTEARQTTAVFSCFTCPGLAPVFSLIIKEQNTKGDITYTKMVGLNLKEAQFLVGNKGDKMDLATQDGHVYRSLAAYPKRYGNIPFWQIHQVVEGRRDRSVSVPIWKREELLGLIQEALTQFEERIAQVVYA